MNINDYRNQIDEINMKLLKLLNERAEWVVKIGKYKSIKRLPVLDEVREKTVFSSLNSNNDGPFENEAIKRIFNKIIEESKTLQNNPKSSKKEK